MYLMPKIQGCEKMCSQGTVTEDDIQGIEHRQKNYNCYIGRKGSVAAAKRAPEHLLPAVGDIILYNENTDQAEAGRGSFGKTPRGVGKVIGFGGHNNCQMWVLLYRKPGCNYRESFLANDFRVGLYRYRKLKDYVYTTDRYNFYDLDITNPHKDIVKLFADDGNYVIPDELRIYAGAVR